jgi:hypothetical protein
METDPIRSSVSSHNNLLQRNDSIKTGGAIAFIDKTKIQLSKFTGCFQKRQVLAIYSFFGFFFAYSLRANFSVAIVEMSKAKFETKPFEQASSSNHSQLVHKTEEWSTVLQGYVLSSFFYGYIATQLPAGT